MDTVESVVDAFTRYAKDHLNSAAMMSDGSIDAATFASMANTYACLAVLEQSKLILAVLEQSKLILAELQEIRKLAGSGL